MAQRYPDEVLDEIKERTDLVSLIEGYVNLKKAGASYKGLCPFHDENTPSFVVSPQKNIYHCFGCGQGGTAFKFVMDKEGLNFPEAVRFLADRVGVDLTPFEKKFSDQDQERYSQAKKKKQLLWKINQYAAWFYRDCLQKDQGQISSYLNSRGIEAESVEKFNLGYAPDTWDGLVKFLQEKKVPLHLAEEIGLLRTRSGGGYYDFFRGRLMFPIHDREGKIVGFGGRILDDETKEAKYVNSSESPIYHKSDSIYGLYQARDAIQKQDQVVLVEGYLDVIRLAQAGWLNAVAPLGTALTTNQVKILHRWASQILIMFDGDEAGQKAQERALEVCFDQGIQPRLVTLPAGEDPDSLVDRSRTGKQVLANLIPEPQSGFEWLMVRYLSDVGTDTVQRVEAAKKVLHFVERLPEGLEKQSALSRLTQFLGINEAHLGRLKTTPVRQEPAPPIQKKPSKTKNLLERKLIQLYVRNPSKVHPLINHEVFSQFEDHELKSLGESLTDFFDYEGSLDWVKYFEGQPQWQQDFVSGLLLEHHDEEDAEVDLVHEVQSCLRTWQKQKLKQRLKQLSQRIQLAEMKKNQDELKQLLLSKSETVKELRAL